MDVILYEAVPPSKIRRGSFDGSRQEGRLPESGNQLFVKNGRGEPFCPRRLGGCFPLKSLNPYFSAASAAMTTLPDFDISCGSEYNEAIARPENLGVSWLASILSPPGIFAMTDLDLSVAVGPGQIDTTATLYGLKSCAISNVSLSRPALVAP